MFLVQVKFEIIYLSVVSWLTAANVCFWIYPSVFSVYLCVHYVMCSLYFQLSFMLLIGFNPRLLFLIRPRLGFFPFISLFVLLLPHFVELFVGRRSFVTRVSHRC